MRLESERGNYFLVSSVLCLTHLFHFIVLDGGERGKKEGGGTEEVGRESQTSSTFSSEPKMGLDLTALKSDLS